MSVEEGGLMLVDVKVEECVWTYCHGRLARVFDLDVSAETASGRHFEGGYGGCIGWW